jgi:hypothetical protein
VRGVTAEEKAGQAAAVAAVLAVTLALVVMDRHPPHRMLQLLRVLLVLAAGLVVALAVPSARAAAAAEWGCLAKARMARVELVQALASPGTGVAAGLVGVQGRMVSGKLPAEVPAEHMAAGERAREIAVTPAVMVLCALFGPETRVHSRQLTQEICDGAFYSN